jgi:hypothetical protein
VLVYTSAATPLYTATTDLNIDHRIGHADARDMDRVDQAILSFSGWAASRSASVKA